MKLYAEVFGIVDLGERLIVDLVLGLDGVLLVGTCLDETASSRFAPSLEDGVNLLVVCQRLPVY